MLKAFVPPLLIKRVGLILGIKIHAKSPAISHLLFVDDYHIFFKVNIVKIKAIKDSLNEFSEASGQVINHEKSELFFSFNTPRKFKKVNQGDLNMKKSLVIILACLPLLIGKKPHSLPMLKRGQDLESRDGSLNFLTKRRRWYSLNL